MSMGGLVLSLGSLRSNRRITHTHRTKHLQDMVSCRSVKNRNESKQIFFFFNLDSSPSNVRYLFNLKYFASFLCMAFTGFIVMHSLPSFAPTIVAQEVLLVPRGACWLMVRGPWSCQVSEGHWSPHPPHPSVCSCTVAAGMLAQTHWFTAFG